MDERVQELKGVESRISTANTQKNESEGSRFKSIVTMYEGMKPKDAAKVFDRLEMAVLIEIDNAAADRIEFAGTVCLAIATADKVASRRSRVPWQ